MNNLPAGITEEKLLKGLSQADVNPTGLSVIACQQPQDTSGEVWFSDAQACNNGAAKIQQSKDKIGLGSAQIVGASYIQTPGGDDIFAGDISKPASTPGGTPSGTPGNTPGADVIPTGTSATPGNTPKPAPQATPTPGAGTRYTDGTGMTPGQNNPTPQPLTGAATAEIKSTPMSSGNMKMPQVGQMHQFSKLPALGSQPKPAVVQQEIIQEQPQETIEERKARLEARRDALLKKKKDEEALKNAAEEQKQEDPNMRRTW